MAKKEIEFIRKKIKEKRDKIYIIRLKINQKEQKNFQQYSW